MAVATDIMQRVQSRTVAVVPGSGSWSGGSASNMDGVVTRLVTSTNATSVSATQTLTLPWAWDFNAQPYIELRFWVDNAANLYAATGGIIIYAAKDATMTKAASAFPLSSLCAWQPIRTGWNTIRIDRREFSLSGGFADSDWASVSHIRVNVRSVAGATVNVHFANISTVLPRGIVMLVHDDADASLATAWEIERANGLKSSSFLVTHWVGDTGRVTWSQIERYYRMGFDMGSHTDHHVQMSTQDATAKGLAVATAYGDLITHGLIRSAPFFAAPYGEADANITAAVSPFHRINRNSVPSPTGEGSKYPVADQYVAASKSWGRVGYVSYAVDDPSLATIKGYVTAMATKGQLMCILTHIVGDANLSTATYNELCAHIAAANVDCLTFSEYFDGVTYGPTAAPLGSSLVRGVR